MRAEKEGGVEDVFQIFPLGIYKYMGIYLDFLCIYYVGHSRSFFLSRCLMNSPVGYNRIIH